MTLDSFEINSMPIKMANHLFMDPRYKRRQIETDGALVSDPNRALLEGSQLFSSRWDISNWQLVVTSEHSMSLQTSDAPNYPNRDLSHRMSLRMD